MFKTLAVPLLLAVSTAHAAETVRIYNWSSYIAPDTLKVFTERTGYPTQYDLYDSNEVLDAKLSAGHSGYDVVFPSNHFMARQITAGALKPLDRSKLPNWHNLNPALMKALEANDPGNRYGFPYLWGSTGIGYNIDKVKAVLGDTPIDSWDVVFKPENMKRLAKCGVAFLDNGPEILPIALNYLGLPHHSQNKADYDKAQTLLMGVRPYVRYFHNSKYTSDLANGDVCLVVGFSGDVMQAASRASEAHNGQKIAYVIPKEGSPMWFDMVAMPADAPDEAAGYAYLNYLLEPAVMANISNAVHYANGNAAADALVDPAVRNDPMVYPPEQVIQKLFVLQAVPLATDRMRTRIWSRVKNGE